MNGYYAITRVTDYGPYTTKLILPIGQPLKAGLVDETTFSVYAAKIDTDGQIMKERQMTFDRSKPPVIYDACGYLEVRRAYVSDGEGNEVEEGSFVTLEPAYGPKFYLSAHLTNKNGYNVIVDTIHEITQVKPIKAETTINGLSFTRKLKDIWPDTEGWINSVSSYEECPLNYGYYIPQRTGGKKPLIVWLHGAGEGGLDTSAAYCGNKVTALTSKKIQDYFDGAYVLAPQTKTYWMDSGSGQIKANGRSRYVKALKACIDEFVAKNPGIDRKRILIGGDSNGGFMTVRMIINYPHFFAGAFPVCEAFPDSAITDTMIENIKHLPIWFVAAKTDFIVPPAQYAEPTYKRLKAAGAKDVHFTYWDKVEDIHGFFDPVDGKPFEYMGHFSWIPTFNDDCAVDYDGKPVVKDGQEVTLLKWLSLIK